MKMTNNPLRFWNIIFFRAPEFPVNITVQAALLFFWSINGSNFSVDEV